MGKSYKCKQSQIKITKKSDIKKIFTPEQINQIIYYYNKNHSIHAIAEAAGYSWKSVNNIIKKEIKTFKINENQVTLAYKDRQTNRYDNILHNIYIYKLILIQFY